MYTEQARWVERLFREFGVCTSGSGNHHMGISSNRLFLTSTLPLLIELDMMKISLRCLVIRKV